MNRFGQRPHRGAGSRGRARARKDAHRVMYMFTALAVAVTGCGLRATEASTGAGASIGAGSGVQASGSSPGLGGATVSGAGPGASSAGGAGGTATGGSSGGSSTGAGQAGPAPSQSPANPANPAGHLPSSVPAAATGSTAGGTCPNNSNNNPNQGVTPTTLTIGGLLDTSSAATSQLTPYIDGLKAGILWINNNGGICGRQVKLVIADTQDNSGIYYQQSRTLIDSDHVFSLVSGDLSVDPSYVDQAQVPVIGGESASPVWYQAPMYFPIGNQYNGTAMLAYWPAVHHLIHKAAVMSLSLAVSQQGCAVTVQELKSLGVPVVYQASVPIGATDVSSYVQQAHSDGADGILQCFDINTSVVLERALQQANWHPYVASSSGASDAALLSSAPPSVLQGMQVNFPVPSWFDTSVPMIVNDYEPAYKAANGPKADQSDWGVRGFISIILLQKAVEEAGPSRQAVIHWLNHQKPVSLDGLLPPDQSYVPGSNGAHPEPKCSQVYEIENDQFVSVSHGWVCLSAG